MYIFLTKDVVLSILISFGIDVTGFSQYQLSIIFILSNIYQLIFISFAITFLYKFILRLIKVMF